MQSTPQHPNHRAAGLAWQQGRDWAWPCLEGVRLYCVETIVVDTSHSVILVQYLICNHSSHYAYPVSHQLAATERCVCSTLFVSLCSSCIWSSQMEDSLDTLKIRLQDSDRYWDKHQRIQRRYRLLRQLDLGLSANLRQQHHRHQLRLHMQQWIESPRAEGVLGQRMSHSTDLCDNHK